MRKTLLVIGIVLLVLGPLVFVTGVGVTFMMPKIYEAVAVVEIAPPYGWDLKEDHPVFKEWIRTEAYRMRSAPMLRVVSSNLNLTEVWGEYYAGGGHVLPESFVCDLLARQADITAPLDLLGVVEIRYRSEDPSAAARLANEIAMTYREERLQEERRKLERLVRAYKNELDLAAKAVDRAEEEMNREGLSPEQRAEKERAHLVAKGILEELRKRIEQEGKEMPLPESPVRLIAPATAPKAPISPRLYTNILVSLFAALLLMGMGVGCVAFGLRDRKEERA